jgi:UDP-N-acetylmuramate--alanine ligase
MNVQPGGLLLVSDSDPRIQALTERLEKAVAPFHVRFYGVGEASAWQAHDIETNASGGTSYAAYRDGELVANVALQVPGTHNALNSLAALAACLEVSVNGHDAAAMLGEFLGAERRFEIKGEARGITIVDDYAHHPTEIAATLQAARQLYPGKRLVVVFQPHTYTRTRDFLDDFATSLDAADLVFVTEIYASRERDTLGMSGRHIVEKMDREHAFFVPDLEGAIRALFDTLGQGDVLITMGAGDIWKVGERVLALLQPMQP